MFILNIKVKNPILFEKFFIDVLNFEKNYEDTSLCHGPFGLKLFQGNTKKVEGTLKIKDSIEDLKSKVDFFKYRTQYPVVIEENENGAILKIESRINFQLSTL